MACTQDFVEGEVIYVRGQKAICKHTDEYPLIFWAYYNNPSVSYHRSLKDDADMFSIHPPESESKDPLPSIESKASEPDDDAAFDIVSSRTTKPTTKTIYEKLEDDTVKCDVPYPGAVHIEKCIKTTFTLEKKVSNITLVDCENVILSFSSVNSKVDIFRSVACEITCTGTCSLYILDSCKNVKITFGNDKEPKNSDAVEFKTTKCSETSLLSKSSNFLYAIEKETEYEYIKSTDGETKEPQFSTVFEKQKFSTTIHKQDDSKLNKNLMTTSNLEDEVKEKIMDNPEKKDGNVDEIGIKGEKVGGDEGGVDTVTNDKSAGNTVPSGKSADIKDSSDI